MFDGLWFSPALCDEESQVGSAFVQVIPTPRQKTADIDCRFGTLVAAHRPISLLDPPANRPLTAVVSAIYRLSLGTRPFTIAGQVAPQTPSVEEQEPQAVSKCGLFTWTRRSGVYRITLQHLRHPRELCCLQKGLWKISHAEA